ncbi:MAG: NUMOD4 domain-containing protein [Pseudomonadota bacterium]|nr:NUMOD4 domain-containing protein [Pseudomonadota bacterium]
MQEIWKPISGYEGLYEVSNLGRVKSLGRMRVTKGGGKSWLPERIKAASSQREGYVSAHLYKNSKMSKRYIHRLVAEAFLANPNSLPQVNHLDGDKANNAATNLEWCSASDNCRHAVDFEIYQTARGEQSAMAKLTEESVIEIRQMAASGWLHREIAEIFGVGRKAVTKIVNRQRWKHVA